MKQSQFEQTYMRIDDKNLGQGAQGAVFRVVRKDDPEGQVYAAKTYHCGSQQSKQINKFFQREVNAYSLLPDCPFIGKLVESFDDSNTKVLILELINGKSFQDCLYTQTKQDKIMSAKTGQITKTKVTFTKEQIIKWTLQMASIIQTLQKNSVLYGDLHFRNLMITSAGNLILTDFGFSFILDKSTGIIEDKTCQYKWMKDKLMTIEKNCHSPKERVKKIFSHHVQFLSGNLRAFLDHCSAPKEEIKDLIELQKLMMSKITKPNGKVLNQERASIQEIIATLHKIAIKENYDIDESLFIIEEEEILAGEETSEESELSESEKKFQIAEQYVDMMFGHIF